jgi:HK97 family phage major capsid protein
VDGRRRTLLYVSFHAGITSRYFRLVCQQFAKANQMNLKKLIAAKRAEISNLVAEVEAIDNITTKENRVETAEEKARLEAITAKGGLLDQLGEEVSTMEQRLAVLDRATARMSPRLDEHIENSHHGFSEPERVIRVPARARGGNRLTAFKGVNAEADAYASGRFLMATIGGDQASRQWCREHGLVTNAMGENNDLLGGVLVIPQFESAIVNLKETFGVFGQYVRNVPMTSDQWIGPRRLSGLTAYAVTEAQQITDSDATMNQVSLTAKKWGTLTRISSELSEDAIIAVADFLANEIAYAHAVKEDQAGFLGDGTTTHNGIVGVANALLAGSVATAAASQNTAASLTIAVFQDAVSKIPQFPGIQPRWFVHSAVYWNVMARLQLAAGGNNVSDLGNGPVMQFMGYPVTFAQCLPATVGASTKFAYFGDLSMAATKGNRRGVTIAADSSRYFEFDQTAIRSTLRYDIAVHERGTASVAGPMVSLVSAS